MPSAQTTSNFSNLSISVKNKSSRSDSTKLISTSAISNSVQTESMNLEQDSQSLEKQNINSTGNKTPQEQPEFIKQALIIIEKKVRNLEKRRIKLEEYKSNQRKGEKLNEDQLSAVSKYDEVIRTLELTRELEKQFVSLANDAMKQQKKQAKKEQLEREDSIKEKLKETHKYISLLNNFKDKNIRNDFLNENGGACRITEKELSLIDEFQNLVQPCELGIKLEAAAGEVADHLICLSESKNKPLNQLNNITYLELRKIFDKILTSEYWTQKREPLSEKFSNEATEILNKEKSPIKKNESQQEDIRQIEQRVFHEQNTSDDYVLVSSAASATQALSTNEFNESKKIETSPLTQLNSQPKTFFSTLNPAELSTQFLNRSENINDEGINFLQDSEIQIQQQSDNFQNKEMQINNNFQEFNEGVENKDNSIRQSQKGNQNSRDFNRSNYSRQRYSDERRIGANNMGQRINNSNGQQFGSNNRNQNGSGYRNNQSRTDNRSGNNYYRGPSNNSGRNGNSRSGFRNQQDQNVQN